MTRPPTSSTRHHTTLLHLAQATVAAGALLIVLGVTSYLGGTWAGGLGLGLLAAWGVLTVPLQPTASSRPDQLARDGRSSDAA